MNKKNNGERLTWAENQIKYAIMRLENIQKDLDAKAKKNADQILILKEKLQFQIESRKEREATRK